MPPTSHRHICFNPVNKRGKRARFTRRLQTLGPKASKSLAGFFLGILKGLKIEKEGADELELVRGL
jgi:hypothetical protein